MAILSVLSNQPYVALRHLLLGLKLVMLIDHHLQQGVQEVEVERQTCLLQGVVVVVHLVLEVVVAGEELIVVREDRVVVAVEVLVDLNDLAEEVGVEVLMARTFHLVGAVGVGERMGSMMLVLVGSQEVEERVYDDL